MRNLVTAALAALAIAAAASALAANGPATTHQGAPVAVGSGIARSGPGPARAARAGAACPSSAKPPCPAGSISCGKDCRPANSTCPRP
jgi:hypothetical protein